MEASIGFYEIDLVNGKLVTCGKFYAFWWVIFFENYYSVFSNISSNLLLTGNIQSRGNMHRNSKPTLWLLVCHYEPYTKHLFIRGF